MSYYRNYKILERKYEKEKALRVQQKYIESLKKIKVKSEKMSFETMITYNKIKNLDKGSLKKENYYFGVDFDTIENIKKQ